MINRIQNFISSANINPYGVAIAAGLYPILFYFTSNFELVNTWDHLRYFVMIFLIVPIVIFFIAQKLSKSGFFGKWQKYVFTFLNIFAFLFFISICYHGSVHKKISLLILIAAFPLSYLLYRWLKKIVVLQFILAFIGVFSFGHMLLNKPSYSDQWMIQPDAIETVTFKKKPNIYFLQPDGYVNFSEIKKGHYNMDNSKFENFLAENEFTNYPNFRSNYTSTLSSNSSIFSMKHHYYNKEPHPDRALNARDIIVTKNAVVDIFKQNGYKTHLILELPYIMLDKPKMGFDKSNFTVDEIPYINTGFENKKEVLPFVEDYLLDEDTTPKFFFVEIFNPGHINNKSLISDGSEGERKKWEENLETANKKLTAVIEVIKEKDPNGLIMILSDHGGYVGLDYATQMYDKQTDRDVIYSIFGSILAIHWPNNEPPEFDSQLKSSVNVFRIIFSYLSEDDSYLLNLQEDSSFGVLKNGAPEGIYKYIDDTGKIVFEKRE